jgi:hypothetical protein
MNSENIAIALKRFLLVEQCPLSWKGLDLYLYLFRDDNIVFYVGQSHLAFSRVLQNSQPTPLPISYLPPNAPFRRRRSLDKLIHEAT